MHLSSFVQPVWLDATVESDHALQTSHDLARYISAALFKAIRSHSKYEPAREHQDTPCIEYGGVTTTKHPPDLSSRA